MEMNWLEDNDVTKALISAESVHIMPASLPVPTDIVM